jgi:hypothetical protein
MLIVRWLRRTAIALLALFLAVYCGDWALYKLRGAPTTTVTVNRFLTVPLKGGKQEFDYLGTAPVPCARALFPQGSLAPCWQLRRNPNQNTAI